AGNTDTYRRVMLRHVHRFVASIVPGQVSGAGGQGNLFRAETRGVTEGRWCCGGYAGRATESGSFFVCLQQMKSADDDCTQRPSCSSATPRDKNRSLESRRTRTPRRGAGPWCHLLLSRREIESPTT